MIDDNVLFIFYFVFFYTFLHISIFLVLYTQFSVCVHCVCNTAVSIQANRGELFQCCSPTISVNLSEHAVF